MKYSANILVVVVLLFVTFHDACLGSSTKLPPEQRKVLDNSSRFGMIHTALKLPASVVALCVDENGRLAEPGAKWQPTDYITDSSLPGQRLIWAATDGEYYVVHYERGGYARSFHIMVVVLGDGQQRVRTVWRSVGNKLKDYNAFVAALRGGELDDQTEYH